MINKYTCCACCEEFESASKLEPDDECCIECLEHTIAESESMISEANEVMVQSVQTIKAIKGVAEDCIFGSCSDKAVNAYQLCQDHYDRVKGC